MSANRIDWRAIVEAAGADPAIVHDANSVSSGVATLEVGSPKVLVYVGPAPGGGPGFAWSGPGMSDPIVDVERPEDAVAAALDYLRAKLDERAAAVAADLAKVTRRA